MTVENSLGSEHSSSTSEPSVTESDQQLSVVSIVNCSSSGRATSTISLPPEAKRSKTLLTKRQNILIQNSWKRAPKSGEHVGIKMFFNVLMARPDAKSIFGLHKVPNSRLKYDVRFRQHAVVYLKTFEYIIHNLNYTEKLRQHFQALGRRHALLQGRGFIPEYWDTFEDAMVRTVIDWEGGVRSCETLYCWKYLVRNFIPLIPLNGTRIMLSELCIPKKVLTKKFSKLIGFIFTDKIDCETVFI
ncbi:unnamed protein product [Anisakis simplex]|uniref:GLOBIN domain-containing protein n=1 Tax=Anisakis simplex TaxID=6269 RepID=A0A0M3KE82_ANISI|nr:unnamed protein product [Anisakis simplex]